MPVPKQKAATARTLLRDQAYARLRDAILDGTLEPGEQLRDAELSEWLGLSRTPIREALARLEEYGLEYVHPDPVVHIPFPDGTWITQWRDLDRTCEEFARFSGRDAEGKDARRSAMA